MLRLKIQEISRKMKVITKELKNKAFQWYGHIKRKADYR